MTSNLGTFSSKYHGLGDGRLTIAGIWNCRGSSRSAIIFLASILDDALLHFTHVNKDGAPPVDLTVKLDMVVVLAVFTFVGAVLLGAF
jgi:hypothetical protein